MEFDDDERKILCKKRVVRCYASFIDPSYHV
jgi:hypothetical protein